jgi:catechol 2,3-dioxygenase-like lactoylglutathione lyase family enzyme
MSTLHQVFLMVTDVDETVAFYRDALGLDVIERGERSATFDTGRCSLVVEREFDAETLSGFGLSPPGESRGDGVIVVLEVDDVDAVNDSAVAADADVAIPPRDVDWGRRMFLVRDPDGYVVEVSRPLD